MLEARAFSGAMATGALSDGAECRSARRAALTFDRAALLLRTKEQQTPFAGGA
jgi:hypothetical protein